VEKKRRRKRSKAPAKTSPPEVLQSGLIPIPELQQKGSASANTQNDSDQQSAPRRALSRRQANLYNKIMRRRDIQRYLLRSQPVDGYALMSSILAYCTTPGIASTGTPTLESLLLASRAQTARSLTQ
jgi:hypothetical protein